jgi:mercuric ion transport protein
MKIQLLTFPGCPNAGLARQRLQAAISEMGLDASICEVDVSAPRTPKRLRGWGSPTILIDGRDVGAGGPCAVGGSCRIYRELSAISGAPSVDVIRAGLEAARSRGEHRGVLAALPAAVASLLPALACPACLGPFVSVLSAFGIGIAVASDVYAFVLFGTLLIGVVGAVLSTRVHRSPWPLLLTLFGSFAVFAGSVVVIEASLQWLGFPLIVAGAAWSLWLQRQPRLIEVHP